MNQSADLYAVMGNPIAHSKSPLIHETFAKQTRQDLSYRAILVPVAGFEQAVRRFQHEGGKGLNVTVPFKQQAWNIVDSRSERAELAGAVNTIIIESGKLFGENTDGVGIVRDLTENHQVSLAAKRILVLGAGGAVRGVLGPLLAQKPTLVHVVNRTAERATELATLFSRFGNISGSGYGDIANSDHFDIIINGTAASLQNELPPLPSAVVHNAICYDMMYARDLTVFLQWAKMHGARQVLDGLGMLVEQAAESFYLWRTVKPETQPVIQLLRDSLTRA